MMDVLDGLYYSYYWMWEKSGYGKRGSHLATIFFMLVFSSPYIGILWCIPFLLYSTRVCILGVEIPMYVGYFLLGAFLCIRFGWNKRYAYIISQHDKYDNKKYKRLRNMGIIAFWIGGLILFIICCIKVHENAAANQ